jgi:hypothetical protein
MLRRQHVNLLRHFDTTFKFVNVVGVLLHSQHQFTPCGNFAECCVLTLLQCTVVLRSETTICDLDFILRRQYVILGINSFLPCSVLLTLGYK